jgi:hypothetical protein
MVDVREPAREEVWFVGAAAQRERWLFGQRPLHRTWSAIAQAA